MLVLQRLPKNLDGLLVTARSSSILPAGRRHRQRPRLGEWLAIVGPSGVGKSTPASCWPATSSRTPAASPCGDWAGRLGLDSGMGAGRRGAGYAAFWHAWQGQPAVR
jgi:hypothetical protein